MIFLVFFNRKLSVTSLKATSTQSKRRKSSIIKTQMGHFEMQEESTSPEIIVNSTSLFSLSSEAAQLTVKNGSTNDSSQSCNSSRSSDEMSITKRNMAALTEEVDIGFNKVSRDSLERSSLDSDDTSYAKAIKETVNSEVIVPMTSVIQVQSQQLYQQQCLQHCLGTSAMPHHQCCHHHHHHHCHCHQHVPHQHIPMSATSSAIYTEPNVKHKCADASQFQPPVVKCNLYKGEISI